MPASYTLFELNEYIRRVISLNFSESIWVSCEISQIKEVRGNVYLELVHHDETTNEVAAQISAGIWYKSYLFIKNKLGALLPSILREGTQVLFKVQVEFNEKYGLKLIIEDVDPSYTIGQMEMNRQKILQKLLNEGLFQLNKNVKTPSVLQRLAVISSSNAAGYIDFRNHLMQNTYNYAFKITLFQASLQGLNTEREVCKALEEINQKHQEFDCIIIIRGGGSKLDLAWFDNFNIGASIARSFLPVITGIGHDIDSTVTDAVAHTSLKTPTAVADFLIEQNLGFEIKVNESIAWISQLGKKVLRQHEITLSQTTQLLQILPSDIVKRYQKALGNYSSQIAFAAKIKINKYNDLLAISDQKIALLNPKNVLKRGFTMVRQNNTIISRASEFKSFDNFSIEFFDNTVNISQK